MSNSSFFDLVFYFQLNLLSLSIHDCFNKLTLLFSLFFIKSLISAFIQYFIIVLSFYFLIYSEWAVHQHRDSYASYVAHKPLLSYIAISQNESLERTRYTMIQKMIQPCGPKPTENLFDKIKNDPERMKKAEEMVNKTK